MTAQRGWDTGAVAKNEEVVRDTIAAWNRVDEVTPEAMEQRWVAGMPFWNVYTLVDGRIGHVGFHTDEESARAEFEAE